ncbi:hypothetical protein [uncultured Lactobacillus sp.]|uniref:hypothetical protein n=1 Tax=uncultured Lactobacillus sp. TaxID=153152 RepID=UPI0025F461FF|nr:hypothetical protein [uncultured Lactobacillus sp.]
MSNIKFKDTEGQVYGVNIDSIDDIQKIYYDGKIDKVRLIIDNKPIFVNYRNWKKIKRQINNINEVIVGRKISGTSISNEPVSILIRKVSSIKYIPKFGYFAGYPTSIKGFEGFENEELCSITKEQFKYLLTMLEND